MKVSQKFVSIRHYVYNEDTGQWRAVRNFVVYNCQLRSHMLRSMMLYLDKVCADDEWTVVRLATDYLAQPGPLHSRDAWRAAVLKHQRLATIGTPWWNALNNLLNLVEKREAY